MSEIYPIVAYRGFSVAHNGASENPADSASGAMQQSWMRGGAAAQNQPLLNANELTSLSALISYVAYKSGSPEFRVERRLANHFNVPNAKLIPANQYDSAVRYLVDTVSV